VISRKLLDKDDTKDIISWLLEPENPNVRYFTLVDLLDRPGNDPEVTRARKQLMKTDPVAAILAAQHPDGYWSHPGGGYTPSYKSTLYQILFLAEFGTDPVDARVKGGCEYLLITPLLQMVASP